MPVEFQQERFARGFEHPLQLALGLNHAMPKATRVIGNTADESEVGLGRPHDLANRERSRLTCEPETAMTAAHCLDPAEFAKPLDHLHQMILRDAIRLGD